MNDLGELQKKIWAQITDAVKRGDAAQIKLLGPIADEMEVKYGEWSRCLPNGHGGPAANSSLPLREREPLRGGPNPSLSDFTGRAIYAFEFHKSKEQVGTWIEVLVKLAELLRQKYGDQFDELATRVRGHSPYFSANARDLRKPSRSRIGGGKLYVETNLNSNLIVDICYRLLDVVGEQRPSLSFETSPNRMRGRRRRGKGFQEI